MSLFSRLQHWAQAGLDWMIAILSGQQRAPSLEGRRAFPTALSVGFIALGLSGWVIWSSIQRLGQLPSISPNANQLSAIAELEKLQEKDTDDDGLSDYVELLNLKTSPYLRDSDSDGVADGDEVQQNTDPNCPAGQVCTGAIVQPVTNPDSELSPEFLRQALQAAGVAKSILDQVPDDQLLDIYQDVLGQASNTNTEQLPSLTDLQQLSGSEIRQLLKESGVPDSELNQYDDATLKQVFLQALEQ